MVEKRILKGGLVTDHMPRPAHSIGALYPAQANPKTLMTCMFGDGMSIGLTYIFKKTTNFDVLLEVLRSGLNTRWSSENKEEDWTMN